jgi:hypothetical protein
MPYMLTRIVVEDYVAWKAMFDQDSPGARREALGYRLFRSHEQPNEVFVQVEFDSADQASAARERLLASGVLARFKDRSDPTIVDEAETVELKAR